MLVAELKRIEQENEDVSRDLKPYVDEMGRKSSWRYMIKATFFHQKLSEPSVSLELDTILPLLSRQRSIREHKASVEHTNCAAAGGAIRKAGDKSSLNTIASVIQVIRESGNRYLGT